MLRDDERALIEQHVVALRPALSAVDEPGTLVVVTKMMLTLPAQRTNEMGAEAAAEAFMMALDDVPTWSVASAMRGWYRGEYDGEKFSGKKRFDFTWRPGPADLRELSIHERWKVAGRVQSLEKLLAAEKLLEFAPEHQEDMKARLNRLGLSTKEPPPKREHDGDAA